jgi:DGQHR domain-containing protein
LPYDLTNAANTAGKSALNLKPEVTISDEDGKMATLTFPSDAGDYAFVVDGQHRIFSFRDEYRQLSETDVFELPVVCFHNATEEVMGAAFVSINVNRKPVNRDLLTRMKAILGLLDTDIDKACIDLIHDLDEDAASPLKNRILRYSKEKDKWVRVDARLSTKERPTKSTSEIANNMQWRQHGAG